MLGVFTTKYRLLEKMKQANWLFALCMVGYIVLFLVDMPVHALASLNKHVFLPFCMVFIVVSIFIGRHGKTSRLERVLDYVGKRTLDVYVIHYFFMGQIHLADLVGGMGSFGQCLAHLCVGSVPHSPCHCLDDRHRKCPAPWEVDREVCIWKMMFAAFEAKITYNNKFYGWM